jgi:hypothetical protein
MDYSKKIEVLNYFTGVNVVIELDETKTLNENAQRYFKLYAKSKTTKEKSEQMLAELEMEREYLENVVYSPCDVCKEQQNPLWQIKARKVRHDAENQDIILKVVLSASSTQYLNPEMLITAIREKNGVLSTSLTEEHYSILRTSLLKEDMSEFR